MATRNTLDTKERKRLIDEIQSTGKQLIAHGINAKFVKGKDIPIEDLSLYDLCVALIDEAHRCADQGINCKFVCNAVSLHLATNTHNFRERRSKT